MNYTEIINQVKQCIPLIKNWEAIENLNLDFSRVDIEGFMVDKHEDKNGRSWEYSLLTTMYSQANSDESVMKEDESGQCEFVTEYDTPLFYFNEPDEVTIISAEWKGRRIVDENKYEGVLEW